MVVLVIFLTEDANRYSGLKPMCTYVFIPTECAYYLVKCKILNLFTLLVFIQVPSVT